LVQNSTGVGIGARAFVELVNASLLARADIIGTRIIIVAIPVDWHVDHFIKIVVTLVDGAANLIVEGGRNAV